MTPTQGPLEAADFWKLRFLCAEAQRVALEGRIAAMEARAALSKAVAAQDATITELAAKYGFDPNVQTFSLDDQTLTLKVTPLAPSTAPIGKDTQTT